MPLNKSGIYRITNVVNNKCYIGSAVNIKQRWVKHKRQLVGNKHHSVLLQRAWNKYGKESFKFEALLYCEKEELIYFEQFHFDELKPEYNICKIAGSTLGVKHSEETKAKMSELKLGTKQSTETIHKRLESRKNYKHPEKSKLRMSEAKKGKKRSPLTEEWKDKLSKSNKNKKRTEEQIAKMKESAKNRPSRSEEHKHNLSEAMKGRPAHNKGKKGPKQSPETIAKRIATRKRNKELSSAK